jgi:hypothetical protein
MFWRLLISWQLVAVASGVATLPRAAATERVFDWRDTKVNETPNGFRSVLSGSGLPGDWKVVFDEASWPGSEGGALGSPRPTSHHVRPVLAQLSRDRTDARYPMLILDGQTFADFTVSAQFKIVDGIDEQMAGIAFRIQDERNYYYIRASALGQNVNFFKVQDGQLIGPIGAKAEIPRGIWQDLNIQCRGNEVRWSVTTPGPLGTTATTNATMTLRDNTFAEGKIGFWTKSDSVPYFGETRVTYVPRENLAQVLVRDTIRKYPRLQSIKIFAPARDSAGTTIVASTNPSEIGRPGQKETADVIARGVIYHAEDGGNILVTMPLHDSNGGSVAAVKLVMKSFPGQTEKNAIARAMPIVKELEKRVRTLEELTQ